MLFRRLLWEEILVVVGKDYNDYTSNCIGSCWKWK